jgi:hypothetical protein
LRKINVLSTTACNELSNRQRSADSPGIAEGGRPRPVEWECRVERKMPEQAPNGGVELRELKIQTLSWAGGFEPGMVKLGGSKAQVLKILYYFLTLICFRSTFAFRTSSGGDLSRSD